MTNITRKEIKKVFQKNGKKMYYLNLGFNNHDDPMQSGIVKDYNYKILLFITMNDIKQYLINRNHIFYGNKYEINFGELKKIKNDWEYDNRLYILDNGYKTFHYVDIEELSSIKELNKFFDDNSVLKSEKMIRYSIYQ